MKKVLAVLALLSVVLVTTPSYSRLDTCYTTRAELYDYIFTLKDSSEILGFNHIRIDSIGHSSGDQLGVQYPIYAVKFSDNPDVFEDEPTVLIIAHIHAEEVAGIEGIVEFMRYLTYRRMQQPYASIINRTQIYIIPTMNPDGLEVIYSGIEIEGEPEPVFDDTWRKNGYKPPQLDECNMHIGYGGDSCGVDLNRNFELNWIWGDTLWQESSSLEAFDYYRGPGPMSEPEAQAVANFAMQIKPTTSIVWHSSRSGRFGSQTFGAWEWGANGEPLKYSPDSAAIARVQGDASFGYTGVTERWGESSTSPYTNVWAGTQNGALQDWFYWKLGCIQITTETSPSSDSPPANIQPRCSGPQTIQQLAQTLLLPNEWMCRRLINLERSGSNDMDGQGANLKIYTKDAATELPISAEWRNVNTWTPLLHPWYTNEEHGRATFLPPPGQWTVMARKEGYLSDTVTVTINPGASQSAEAILYLQPLEWYDLSLRVEDESGIAIPAKVHLISEFPMWMDLSSGEGTISKPRGNYEIAVVPEDEDNHIAIFSHFWLGQDTSFTYVLPDGDLVFEEDFSNGLANWTSDGEESDLWGLENDTTAMNFGQTLHTNPDPSTWRPVYARNADTWIQHSGTIDLTSTEINSAHLAFDRRGRLEVPADSFFVEVSTDGEAWEVAKGYCDMNLPWTRDWVNLTRWVGNEIYLRFHFVTDESVQELGLNIDNIKVMAGQDEDGDELPAVVPYTYRINKAYPNPFNPSTTIDYEVAAPGLVSFAIFNLLGQEVWSTDKMLPAAGPYRFRWDGVSTSGAALSSGIYFIRMHTNVIHSTKKLMLLK